MLFWRLNYLKTVDFIPIFDEMINIYKGKNMYTEDDLIKFTKPLSETEDQKAQRSIDLVTSAINDYNWKEYGLVKPSVHLKGSYKNNTNVREDSDVDIYVLFDTASFLVNKDSQTTSIFHKGDSGISAKFYKDCLENALKQKIGSGSITRGNKSIKIKETAYKHQTDVVCAFVANDDSKISIYKGICLMPDKDEGGVIVNYPEQDTFEGTQLNVLTDNYYKKIVRILKGIRNDQGWTTPSFLIECLVSNVEPNILCDNTKDYKGKVTSVIDFLLLHLRLPFQFKEVNGIKALFHERQKWGANPDIAITFLKNVKAIL